MTFQYVMMANYSMYRKLLMRRLSDTGLSSGQPKILDYLREHDGESQSEIARANQIEPASLTTLINGMEKKGLVERRRLGTDRRSYHIYLTEKGREVCGRVTEAFAELEREAFPASEPGENYAFQKELEEIYHRLKDMLAAEE